MPSKSNRPKPKKKKGSIQRIVVWIILLGLLFSILAFPFLLGSRVAGEEGGKTSTEEASTLPSTYGPTAPQDPEEPSATQPSSPQPGQEEDESNPSQPAVPGSDQIGATQEGPETDSPAPGPNSEEPSLPEPENPGDLNPDFPDPTDYLPLESQPVIAPFEARADRLTLLLPLDPYWDALPSNAQALNFNPLLFNSPQLFSLASLIYRPLYSDLDQGAYSLLASYDLSTDGKTLHLELKPQLFWGPHQPLTVRDIEFTLDSLVQAPLVYPWASFLSKIVGVEDYWTRKAHLQEISENAENPSLQDPTGPNPEDSLLDTPTGDASSTHPPFILLKGIKSLNDLEMDISFQEDISAQLEEILALPILPARVWWAAPSQDWPQLSALPEILGRKIATNPEAGNPGTENADPQDLSPEELQQIYADAGSGPYSLAFSQDSSDVELSAKPVPAGSPFSPSQIPHLTIRHSRTYEMVDDLINYQADLALLPLLSREDQTRILEAGYKLDKLAGTDLLALTVNTDLEDNPLADPQVLAALYLLAPQGDAMQDFTQVPILSLQGEPLHTDGPSLSERAGLPDPGNQSSAEARQDLALDLLAKAGYTTSEMSEDQLIKAGADAQSLDQVDLRLLYLADDLLSHDCILAWDQHLLEAGVDIKFQAISREELGTALTDQASGLVLHTSPSQRSPKWPSYALYHQAYFFAYQRLSNFEPQAPSFFLGAENWALEGQD